MTVNTVVNDASEFAGALLGLALDNSLMTFVENDVNTMGLNPFLNSIYTQLFGSQSSATVAHTIVQNLGINNSAEAVTQFIQIALDAAAPSNTQGQTVVNILNMFSGLTADATWGTAATSWVNEVDAADAYSQNSASASNVPITNIPSGGAPTGTGSTVDISGFTGMHDLSSYSPAVSTLDINSSSATASLLNLAANVTVNDNIGSDSSVLTLTHAGSGPNSLTVNFNGGGTLHLTSTGDSSLTLNTPTGGVNNATFILAETDNQLSTLKFTGGDNINLFNSYVSVGNSYVNDTALTDVGASIPSGTTVASSLAKIDASGTTGAVTIQAGATINGVSYTGLVIYGGGNGDTISNYADNGSITEGATAANTPGYKNNTLDVSGVNASINDSASTLSDKLTLSGFGDSATLGSGNDQLTMFAGESAVLGSGHTTVTLGTLNYPYGTVPVTGTDTVTVGSGQATIVDGLQLQGNANGNILAIDGNLNNAVLNIGYNNSISSLGTASSVSNAQSLDQAINQFLGTGKVAWFEYGGNTYIELSGSTYANSYVVKLAGLVDLSHATAASGSIYL